MEKNIEHIGFWEVPKEHPFIDLKEDNWSDTDETVEEFKGKFNYPVSSLKETYLDNKTIIISE